jgi:peptide/nickel transport system ATP-binding protein
MSEEPLLRLDAVRVALGGKTLLNALSLEVRQGEIVGLVGASGSGKSLTALAIMGLLPRTATLDGGLYWRGRPLFDRSPAALRAFRGREVGMVFQEPMTALNPLLTIGAQVGETVRLHTTATRGEAARRAAATLDRVGLGPDASWLARYPHELSGGQRQRVAIAMAITLSPALLIADEPTTALDSTTQAQVLALLKTLVRDSGMSLLLVSHDMAVMAATTTRLAVLEHGRIVEQGLTAEILQGARSPYARRLLDAARLAPRAAEARSEGGVSAPSSDAPLLEVRDVVREISLPRRSPWARPTSRRLVDAVSLTVSRGEIVGLIGESGSGKSSLLRLILALDRPQSGSVRLSGELFSSARGAHLRRLRRQIQIVFQDPYGSFDPEWTVERIVAEPLHLLDVQPTPGERRSKVSAALEAVGLSSHDARRYPHEFSGGQRQRIAIARALISEPALIVCDEAVSALDVLVRAQVLELLEELRARLAVSFLFVSHDLQVVRAIADRIYVMFGGRMVEEGDTRRVFAAPRHAFTAELIRSTLTP